MTDVLETQRLVIRPFSLNDFDDLYRLLYADEEVARWWTGRSRDREETRHRFTTEPIWRLDDGFGFRAIVKKTSQSFIGLIGFQRFDVGEDLSYVELPAEVRPVASVPGWTDAELTYAVGRPYQRRGYATEAGRAMLRHVVDELGVARVVNVVDERNEGTVRLMRHLGFDMVPNLRARPDWPSVVGILETRAFP